MLSFPSRCRVDVLRDQYSTIHTAYRATQATRLSGISFPDPCRRLPCYALLSYEVDSIMLCYPSSLVKANPRSRCGQGSPAGASELAPSRPHP